MLAEEWPCIRLNWWLIKCRTRSLCFYTSELVYPRNNLHIWLKNRIDIRYYHMCYQPPFNGKVFILDATSFCNTWMSISENIAAIHWENSSWVFWKWSDVWSGLHIAGTSSCRNAITFSVTPHTTGVSLPISNLYSVCNVYHLHMLIFSTHKKI